MTDISNKEWEGIAKRLRERREALGYSYGIMEKLTGISKTTFFRYETCIK